MTNNTRIIILSISALLLLSSGILFLLAQAKKAPPELNWARESSSEQVAGVKDQVIGEDADSNPDQVRLLFVGDIMMDRYVGTIIKKNDVNFLFGNILKQDKVFFDDYDIVGANLESAVIKQGTHYPPLSSNDFSVAPELVAELQKLGFNYFAIANNHVTDQGTKGLAETRTNLSTMDLNFSGSPDSVVDVNSLSYLTVNQTKVALISLSMVYHPFDVKEASDLIRQAKNRAELVVLNLHWGTEYQTSYNLSQKKLARELIDAGADLIIGHHPHVVQGMEIYHGKPIFYSLGNFIFDQYFSVETQRGLAVGLTWQQDQWQVWLHPLKSVKSRPELLIGTDRINYLKDYLKRSDLDKDYQQQLLSGYLLIK